MIGNCAAKNNPTKKLILLSGVLPKKKNLSVRKDGELILDPHQRSLIQQSLEIYRKSKNYNFSIKTMHFKKYRGFKLGINDGSCEVFIGQDNYLERLKRVETLFQDIKNKGHKCTKIEVDYSNKAFIRTRL